MVPLLLKRIEELEARLAQNSSNSDRPPSSDPPGMKREKREPTGRKRGGQPGHKKHERVLVPPEEVTRLTDLFPSECERCGERLPRRLDPDPHRHQVVDIPPVTAEVDEYRQHAVGCDNCGAVTRATLPPGVPTGNFGARVQAVVAVSSGKYRMPKRSIEEMLWDFFGVELSLGSVSNLEQATSEAIAAPVDEVVAHVQQQAALHADETSWPERAKKAWLWVAATATAAVFLIRRSRGKDIAKELLGANFLGRLISDRWASYAWVDVARRQLCWAHLVRDFKSFRDWGRGAKVLATQLLRPTRKMLKMWHRVRDGTMTRETFMRRLRPLRLEILYHLRRGADWRVRKVAGVCREILKLQDALWTFATIEGVEPTNNHAERLLRHAVLWRKSSFGTDSERGSRFVERMLTVVATLRLQRRNVLDYVTAACQARLLRQPAPSLLPQQLAYDYAIANAA